MTLVVGTFFWKPDAGSKFAVPYTPDDVRRLQRMVAKHLTVSHQFAVITDQPTAFVRDAPDIRAIPIDRTTHVPGTCFVRLMTFHPKGREMIGEKFLAIDIDTLIIGNIDHLVSREEDLVLWRNPSRVPWADLETRESRQAYVLEHHQDLLQRVGGDIDFENDSIACFDGGATRYVINQRRTHYNTSVLLHRCGSRPDIWQGFDARRPPAKDDQWYLSDLFGMNAPGYFDGARDGVYRLPRDDTPDPLWVGGKLPANACIVTFPGSNGKPDDANIRAAHPWIAEHLQ
jgi:hypothetical protein